ncbi:hypothetical protein [Capnocytophaga felis]|uniref:Uncharacterized protein n=1 Tax=Capnocytophaga felis TaxID=2267611 RepID=A0A5M4BBM1_9FLAO|nr:hypothetical protein [Capnocytophaga felis]GET46979.1 hypothetical protein RCZ01_22810 [Capnocytophaga felis]GET49499.1 hypothetical protein RCZ02_23300 [Capnocytophaga felis]
MVAPLYGYLEYKRFLKGELETFDEYSKGNSFMVKSEYDGEKLNLLWEELGGNKENGKFIEKIAFDDFKRVFNGTKLKDIDKPIIWKLKAKNNKENTDWQSLLILIDELVGLNFKRKSKEDWMAYAKEIKKIIGRCFELPNGDIKEKLNKSFKKYWDKLKENKDKRDSEIIRLIDGVWNK